MAAKRKPSRRKPSKSKVASKKQVARKAPRTKPSKKLSPQYRKRIERAQKKGLTRQAARGHKPREHIARKRREIERAKKTGALTSAQKQTIKKWDQKHHNTDRPFDEFMAKINRYGYKWFELFRDNWNMLYKQYVAANHQSLYSRDEFEDYADDLEVDFRWLYYH